MNNKRKIIGVCGARIFNEIPMQFINTLREQSVSEGYFTIAFSSDADDEEETEEYMGESQLYELTKYIDFSALIILSETLKNKKIINKIIDIGHSKNIPVFTMDGSADGCINMNFDYYDGFEDMVRHIVEYHGCKRVNMLAGFKGNNFSDARIEAYKKVLVENGIPFEQERVAYGDFWERPAKKAVENFINSDLEMPQAIVCANDAMAIVACSVLHEHGYNIPEDIIVTGFDGTISGGYHFPVISTCEPDYERAVKFIINKIKESETSDIAGDSEYTINFRVKKGQSCGCGKKTTYAINTVISSLSQDVGDCSWHNIAMSKMLTSVLNSKDIKDIVRCIPEYTHLWSKDFRFACLKSDLIDGCKVSENYNEMTTILRVHKNVYGATGEKFNISEFMPHIDEVMAEENDVDILVVRQLNSGKDVYGYIVEGFPKLKVRPMQRCNEFAVFLTHAINSVIHNFRMTELNNNLTNAYNKIADLYLKDYMTGVYNRRGFYKNINNLISGQAGKGKYLYIFSIDIDRLKYINDNFGHAEGDFAITTVAKAIVCTGSDDAICARFGGDEFACAMISDFPDTYSAEGFYNKLLEHIGNTAGVSEKEYPLETSVGMYCEELKEGLDVEGMILAADRGMYKEKSEHRKNR